jgi:hypothetical protein
MKKEMGETELWEEATNAHTISFKRPSDRLTT